ncbi:hypothetical protein AN448_19195 [Pseudomonas aeruginosa]|uniref:hypothetical protein n=1 Tax=Pseudomonas aeruginosa TaxID=287 RepID=UPI000717828A|nr:hypothetical protein [Pseudomonas aeruginosa]KRU64141.1 hypothetical protein AN448_19195 [Pseudomonas aeruginosa]SUC60461.1 Keratin type II cytoskeletal 75 [Pseudomonas aeruginosa]
MVGQDVMRCLMALGLVLQGLSFGAQAAPGGAVELYRYVNDKGVVVLDRQGVPPQYIGKGYQERAGRPVAQALVDQLDDLKQEEKRLQGEIGRFQKAREDAERTYAADRARLSQLLGVSP